MSRSFVSWYNNKYDSSSIRTSTTAVRASIYSHDTMNHVSA